MVVRAVRFAYYCGVESIVVGGTCELSLKLNLHMYIASQFFLATQKRQPFVFFNQTATTSTAADGTFQCLDSSHVFKNLKQANASQKKYVLSISFFRQGF